MNTAIPDSSAIADAMLKRTGEVLREQKAGATVPRLASYFQNEAPEGAPPRYSEVEKQFFADPDVFPLYFGPADPRAVEQAARLTPERISELWNGMPGGCSGFLKQWGYQQFAEAVEDEVRATLLAAPSPTVGDEAAPSDQPSGLTPASLAEEMFDTAIHYSNGHVTDFRERAESILARNGAPT